MSWPGYVSFSPVSEESEPYIYKNKFMHYAPTGPMRGDDNQMKHQSRIMHLLKASLVKCWPVPLIQTLERALINTLIDTQLTCDWYLDEQSVKSD